MEEVAAEAGVVTVEVMTTTITKGAMAPEVMVVADTTTTKEAATMEVTTIINITTRVVMGRAVTEAVAADMVVGDSLWHFF